MFEHLVVRRVGFMNSPEVLARHLHHLRRVVQAPITGPALSERPKAQVMTALSACLQGSQAASWSAWGEVWGEPFRRFSGPNANCRSAAPFGADDGIRTRDPHLGKVVLYQLSHVRVAPILPRGYIPVASERPGTIRPVFTVEERDQFRNRLLEMAREDPRIAAAALVGSLALGGGHQWSDLDLTFGLADDAAIDDVLADWTDRLEREFGVAQLFDLPYLSTIYRVFLFPGNLQVDLSFTPGAEFGALGPKFELLFGTAVERAPSPVPSAESVFGWGAHHALRARFCIERGRLWHTEYWIHALRDQALTLACLRHGLPASYGRGFDDLPADVLDRFDDTLVRSLDRAELLRALDRAVDGLLAESEQARGLASKVEGQLRQLTAPGWPAMD
jgi:hypothetical protein